MTDRLDLSIVVPAFNAELTLERALRSTLPLLDAGAECVVVNDGSVDSTVQVAAALQGMHREIRLVDQANMGLSGARNRGIAESRRGWITFLDSDDELVATGIVQAIVAATSFDVAIGKSRIHQTSTPGIALDESPRDSNSDWQQNARLRPMANWLLEGWGGILGCVFNADLIRPLSPPFVKVPFGEDLIFIYTLATLQEAFAQTDHVGYRYVMGSGQQMTAPTSRLRLAIAQAFKACEDVALRSSPQSKALFWALIQRYRWSRSRQVAADFRPQYREEVSEYARGLRGRLGISRSELADELLGLGRTWSRDVRCGSRRKA